MANYFGAGKENNVSVPYSLEELKSEDQFEKFVEMYYLLGYSLDCGVDLSGFEEYGIIFTEDGSVSIDESRYIRWDYVNTMFQFIRTSQSFDQYRSDFIELGINAGDVDKIRDYIDTADIHSKSSKNGWYYWDKLVDEIKTAHVKGLDTIAIMVKNRYEQARSHAILERKWAIDLLEQLDEEGQSKMITYRSFGHTQMSMTPTDLEAEFSRANEIIMSGKYLEFEEFRSCDDRECPDMHRG